MLGQGPHQFIWPATVEATMPTAPALHNMLTTNQWPHCHIDVCRCPYTGTLFIHSHLMSTTHLSKCSAQAGSSPQDRLQLHWLISGARKDSCSKWDLYSSTTPASSPSTLKPGYHNTDKNTSYRLFVPNLSHGFWENWDKIQNRRWFKATKKDSTDGLSVY